VTIIRIIQSKYAIVQPEQAAADQGDILKVFALTLLTLTPTLSLGERGDALAIVHFRGERGCVEAIAQVPNQALGGCKA
jgi:hypothetical protein